MKKVMILSFVAAAAISGQASAATGATVCAAASAAASGSVVSADTSGFVKVDFTPKCSANVHMSYGQSGTSFGSLAGSAKGKFTFGGGTGGGGVKSVASCATSGCTATNTTPALALVQANAS